MDYAIYMLNLFWERASRYTSLGVMSQLFGGGGMIGDEGWLTILAVNGLVYFSSMTALVFYAIIKNRSIYLKLAIFSLYVSSFHYTVMFWPVSQIIFSLIIIDSFNSRADFFKNNGQLA